MDRAFFERDPEIVAEELIGCLLVRDTASGRIVVRLTETEAYKGLEDPASHAFRGPTPRSGVMFGEAGRLYVYFIYGMHHCINIVSHEPGAAGAVLLRAGLPIEGIELLRRYRPGVKDALLLNGPGKLAAALRIDRSWDGYNPFVASREEDRPEGLAILARDMVPAVVRTPRIGISAGIDLPWRFYAKGL